MSNLWWARCTLALSCLGAHDYCFAAPAADSSRAEAALSETAATDAAANLGVLSGTVSDPSGAKITHADVHVRSTSLERDTTTDDTGRFSLALPPGIYEVSITAEGFKPYTTNITLTDRDDHAHIEARLVIAAKEEEITVPSEDAVSTSAADNKTALVFKGDDLKTFSDDDDVFQKQIQALAGSGDGQSGPQLYVDGFSGGRFPPKNSIREIRINQNQYSAEYGELGYGRIEVFTKPGTDQLHGYLDLSGNDNAFNAPNPFTGAQPPYHSVNIYSNLSGPINKKTSFFASAIYNDQENNSIVDATTLDSNLQPAPFTQALPSPMVSATYSVRLDRQITSKNTFTGRYEFNQAQQTNGGVGLLVLASEGTNSTTTTQTLQISDTQVIGPKMVSEAHFQYLRTHLSQNSDSSAPTVVVEGAFNGGGNPSQITSDNQDRYEFQEFLTRQQGAHFLRFGARYRLLRDANLSTGNYNGQFIFTAPTAGVASSPNAAVAVYQTTLENVQQGLSPTANGGGASQFSITTGQPSAVVVTGDLGLFAEDEWKVSKTFTLDLGFRLETQSAIPDHFDPAPRVGFAWAVGQAGKRPAIVVVRGGGGIFYDRFAAGNILSAIRQNGVTQPSYYVVNPTFYCTVCTVSSLPGLSATPPTIYQISPHLRSEYSIIEGIAVERKLWKKGTITFNYLFDRGVHQWDSVNINAPLPGTYNPAVPSSGIYPLGGTQPFYQFQSSGTFNNSRFFTNIQLKPNKYLSFFGYYVIRHLNTDASGATSFPSNSYDIAADYGRSPYPNQRVYAGGFLTLPYGLSMNAFLSATASAPFNITTGTDLNGDSIYNDRPSFATSSSPSGSIVHTRFGNFDTVPQPGETIIPSNYGNGPAFVELDLGASKSIKFGPRPAAPAPPAGTPAPKVPAPKPDPRYSVAFSFDAENLFNHVNPGPPVGILSSPVFGQSISLYSPYGGNNAANRIIELRTTFSF